MNALQSIPGLPILPPARPKVPLSSLAAPLGPLDRLSLADPPDAGDGKPKASVGQALLSAAKWGAVGGVLSAVPGIGYLVSAAGGAMAADLAFGGQKGHATPMLLGATAGVATHVIPMSGYMLHAFGFYQAFFPATVIFGAVSWGLVAYHNARG